MANPLKAIWNGLKYAGGKAAQGAAFAAMLHDMGIPIPFIEYLKLGMTIAELTKKPGPEKALIAKEQALQIASEHGLEVGDIPSDAMDLVINLLLSEQTNTVPQFAFDVKAAAAEFEKDLPSPARVALEKAVKSASQRMRPKDILIKR